MLPCFHSGRNKWRKLLLLGLGGVLGLVVSLWAVSVWHQGSALQTSFRQLKESIGSDYDLVTSEKALDALEAEAEAFERRLEFLGAFQNLPVVGNEIRGVSTLLTSGIAGIEAARDILRGVSLLRDLSTATSIDLVSASQAYDAFLQAESNLIPVTGPRPRFPLIWTPYDVFQETEQQLRLLVDWGQEMSLLLLMLVDLEEDLVSMVWQSYGLEATLDQVVLQVSVVQKQTREVQQTFPTLTQDLDRLSAILQGLELTADGAVAGLAVLRPILDIVEKEKPSLLHDGPVMTRILSILKEGHEELNLAATQVEVGLDLLPETARASLMHIYDLQKVLGLLADFASVAPSLMGIEGATKYMVLGQTADELRATGGFVSTIWIVTFQGGELVELRYVDTVEVDDLDHLNLYPVPPEGLNRHMQACCWLMRDISWEPDFPFTARMAQEVYELGQAEKVDGVVAINQWTLQRLVDFMDGLPSPDGDGRILPEEFMGLLQERTDEEGRGYVHLLVPGLLAELERQVSPSSLVALGGLVRDLFREKLLLLYMNDPQVQALLHDLRWDGSLADEEGDFLMVVDSNVGWSKVDRNILRSVSYQVALHPEGTSLARLSLEYQNISGPEARSCAWQWSNLGDTYSHHLEACYWNYLRVYLPLGNTLVQADPMPLPAGSIDSGAGEANVVQGVGIVGEETLRSFSAHGKSVLAGLIVVPPGETTQQTFLYELAQDVVVQEGDHIRYNLVLQKQPGVTQREVSVVVTIPPGYRIGEASLSPDRVEEGRVVWQFSLTEDIILEVVFRT